MFCFGSAARKGRPMKRTQRNEAQTSLFNLGHPPRLSRRDAADRRDDGMRRARKHAEKITQSWRLIAMVGLEKFLRERSDPFLAEQFVDWSRKNGVPQPPDGRAWGAVLSSARRLEIIEKVGVGLATTSNLSPKPLWKGVK
jgi:hypothetical protein